MTLGGFVTRRIAGSWYRTALTATAAPVEFLPGPAMTAADVHDFAAPTGTAAPWWRALYVACWAVQLAAAIGVVAAAVSLLATVGVSAQTVAQECQTGQPGCTATASVNPAVPVLWLVGCAAVLVAGRSLRRGCAALMRASALRAAHTVRTALQPSVVLLTPLSPRQRWLLRSAQRMLEHYPPTSSDRVLWDIARRLDAATELRGRRHRATRQWQDAAAVANALDEQAEHDVTALRSAVRDGAAYRHNPCATASPAALPRSSSIDRLITDATLLLPAPVAVP